MLFHGGQFGICALGNGSVGKSTDRYFIGHFLSNQFTGIQNARSCFVIDGEETIGMTGTFQYVRGDGYGAFPCITQHNHAVVHGNFVFLHGIQIAIPTILGDFQMRGCSIKQDTLATCLYHILHGGKRTGIVVHYHPFCFQSGADAIVEHNGDIIIQQVLIMIVLRGILCQRGNHTTDAGGKE